MTEGVDWIRLEFIRKDEIDQRKIFRARCLRCGKEFANHRSIFSHMDHCPAVVRQQTITNFLISYFSPKVSDIVLTSEQEDLIDFFVSINISISAIENPIAVKLFTKCGIMKSEIPTAEVFRKMILAYSYKIKKKNNLKFLSNKSLSLIIDGTTSWNKILYEVALYYPGIVRHYRLFEIKEATSDHLKNAINTICIQLLSYTITVVGITTDNGPNLVSTFKQIEKEVDENKSNFPFIRFSCAAHTAQFLIEDLSKNNELFNNISKSVNY